MKIGQKITFRIVIPVMLAAVIMSAAYYNLEKREELRRLDSLGRIAGPIVERALLEYMMDKEGDTLRKVMEHFREGEMLGISLADREGAVREAAGDETGGPPPTLPFTGESEGVLLPGADIYRWSQPVRNRPECHSCHPPGDKFNGTLAIDFSVASWRTEKTRHVAFGLALLVAGISVVTAGMVFLLRSVVTDRIEETNSKIRGFKGGDYSLRIPLDGNDEITALQGAFNEMADAVASREKELEDLFKKVVQAKEEWQATFDTIDDLIFIHDEDFRIRKANRAFADYIGTTPRDAIGKSCRDLCFCRELVADGWPENPRENEKSLINRQIIDKGINKVFRASSYFFSPRERTYRGLIHIARDITEAKERESHLLMQEKLASIGQVASGIAHEINNPLASIAGCAEGLRERITRGEYQADLFSNYLEIVGEEVTRCKRITTGILAFVRKGASERTALNLNALLDRTIEIIALQGRLRNVKVVTEFNPSLPMVTGSSDELTQAFSVLITNALDAMESSGTLTLKTAGEGGAVLASVADTGPGVPPELREKIFRHFFTTKAEGEGTGLGLGIAEKIVTNHSGSISLSSPPGGGAVFTVRLPV